MYMKIDFYNTMVELLEIVGVEYCGSKNFNNKKYFKRFYDNVVKRKNDFLMHFHNIHYLDADDAEGKTYGWWPRIALHRTSYDLTNTPIKIKSIEHGMCVEKGVYECRSTIVTALSKYEYEKILLEETSGATYDFINKYLNHHKILLNIPENKCFKTYLGARTCLDASFYDIYKAYEAHLHNIVDIYNRHHNFKDFEKAINEMEVSFEVILNQPDLEKNKDKFWN